MNGTTNTPVEENGTAKHLVVQGVTEGREKRRLIMGTVNVT